MSISPVWKPAAAIGAYGVGVVLGALGAYIAQTKLTADPQALAASTIIQHNLLVLGFMLLGVATAGLVSLSILMINGMTLGFVMQAFAMQGQLAAITFALAPHGVFEISGFLLAGIGDLHLATCFIHLLRNPKALQIAPLKRGMLLNSVAVVLIIVAGFVEHFVTPTI